MDLAQKANRVKRELQAAAHKPEETSIRHAIEAFDAFVDGVVEEIGQLKSALKNGSASPEEAAEGLAETVLPAYGGARRRAGPGPGAPRRRWSASPARDEAAQAVAWRTACSHCCISSAARERARVGWKVRSIRHCAASSSVPE